jgi:hypothetical protein
MTCTKSSERIRFANAALISLAFTFTYFSTSRIGSSSGSPVSARVRRSSAISSSLDSLILNQLFRFRLVGCCQYSYLDARGGHPVQGDFKFFCF